MNSDIKAPRKPNPRETINPILALFFGHMFSIFIRSWKKDLTEEDLFAPLEVHKSSILGDKLEYIWLIELKKNKKTALLRSLVKLFWFEIIIIGFVRLLSEIAYIISVPYSIGGLVSYFGDRSNKVTKHEACIYAIILISTLTVYTIVLHSGVLAMMHLSMKVRVACCSLIYRKSLRLSQLSLAQTTIGHMINLLTNDVSKFDSGLTLINFIWTCPIQAVVGTYLLYRAIGKAAFAGIAFLLLFVPLQIYLGKKNSQIRLNTATRTDERIRLMDEILSGIQAIKMYTWEKPFIKLISTARRLEMKAIRIRYYLQAVILSLEMFVTRTSIFITIAVFIYLGNYITADTAYTVTAIYGVLRVFITGIFSNSAASLSETFVTISRLQKFMILEELSASVHTVNTEINEESELLGKQDIQLAETINSSKIFLKSVNAKWFNESTENTIGDINLNIDRGQLVAIIGPVGSGKSSILNVILGELPINGGYMETEGTISYACQECWLFSASVRQNILFGAPYESERYKNVVKVCALYSDLRILPYGDATIVGEKGNALSGGQKARISLARCVYKRADIYLLDDPLSAVDTKVGKRLYDECITKFLKNTICILVTHQVQYLKNADKIVILKNGKIVGDGSYRELQKSGLDFVKLFEEFSIADEEEEAERRLSRSRQNSELSLEHYEYFEVPDDNKEKLESGSIKASTYLFYFRAGGNYLLMILLVVVFIAAQAVGNGGDYFVSYWVNIEQEFHEYNGTENRSITNFEDVIDRTSILYTYAGLIVATISLAIGRSFFYFTFFMRASINLHNFIFSKISYATMRFFNNNPIGRILNRFSRDIGIIDEYIPFILSDVANVGLSIAGTLIVTSIVNVWLIIPSAALLMIFYFLRLVYVKPSRNFKRIEGITRSPMFNHIRATMDGLSTIRAFAAQQVLAKEFDTHQDLHSSGWYLYISCTRCFGLWGDVINIVFLSFIIISLLAIGKDYYYGGDIGLILTQYFSIYNMLEVGIRQWTELENNMTSVERVLEYTKVETEPVRNLDVALRTTWPEFGQIVFKDLSLKYNPQDSPVLKQLNFLINPGEKIGIVGRTGAGKSSTVGALFQLYEVEGAIIIDGVDTTKIPLDDLRSKISIIPQAPVLFSGTIRKNLDPFEEFSDDMLWSALEDVELKDIITETTQGLNAPVSEGGSNFSIGQRQLVCLARAIVRKNTILVLDEATANVDMNTDELIQRTIRIKFADCTVITIAHRLNTVMDSNRILVMDAGRLVEFDHPHNLLQHTDSIFYSMVQTTGKTTAQNLRTVAEESYMKMK